jgi:hypothetical protein
MTRRGVLIACLTALLCVMQVASASAAQSSKVVFGGVPIGSCNLITYEGCSIKLATFTNTTGAPLVYDAIAIQTGMDYALGPDDGTCDFSALAPGASCSIEVTVAPSHVGLDRGAISLRVGTQVVLVDQMLAAGVPARRNGG